MGICCVSNSYAQSSLNLENHDDKPYYFGISLSYTQPQLIIAKNEYFLTQKDIQVVNPQPTNGIAFGLQATGRLNDHFELRLNPQLVIGGSYIVNYTQKNSITNVVTQKELTIPSLITSFPLQLKFNSDRIENFKFYALGGINYNLNLSNNNLADNAEFINLSKNFYGVELGVGCSFYLPFVIISPEIKINYSLSNMFRNDAKSILAPVISSIHSYFTFFTLHFEG